MRLPGLAVAFCSLAVAISGPAAKAGSGWVDDHLGRPYFAPQPNDASRNWGYWGDSQGNWGSWRDPQQGGSYPSHGGYGYGRDGGGDAPDGYYSGNRGYRRDGGWHHRDRHEDWDNEDRDDPSSMTPAKPYREPIYREPVYRDR
jgi:hypothetical protein